MNASRETITIKASGDKLFEVKTSIALSSNLIRSLLEDRNNNDSSDQNEPIPLV